MHAGVVSRHGLRRMAYRYPPTLSMPASELALRLLGLKELLPGALCQHGACSTYASMPCWRLRMLGLKELLPGVQWCGAMSAYRTVRTPVPGQSSPAYNPSGPSS